MCGFAAVRNWFIAMNVAIGGAVSSVIFAYYWPVFATGALLAALGWAAAAYAATQFETNALRSFCNCAERAGFRACALSCDELKLGMYLFSIALWLAMGAIAAALAEGFNFAVLVGLVASFVPLGVMSIGYGINMALYLGPCSPTG